MWKSVQGMTVFPMCVNDITFMCVQTSFMASIIPLPPLLQHHSWLGWGRATVHNDHHRIISGTGMVLLFHSPKTPCYYFILFFSGTTILGKLRVSTTNSEPLIWYYDTLRNDTSIKFDIICIWNFSGPEEPNDNSVKIGHTEMMDRGFTVTPKPTNFGRTGHSMI